MLRVFVNREEFREYSRGYLRVNTLKKLGTLYFIVKCVEVDAQSLVRRE